MIHVGAFFYLKNNKILRPTPHKSHQNKNHKKTHIQYVNIKPTIKKLVPKKKRLKQIENKLTKKISKEKNILQKPKKIIEPKKKIPQLVKKLEEKKIIQSHKPKNENVHKEPTYKIEKLPKEFQKLYKKEFQTLPKESQIYLIKHIKNIGKITEAYLEYPIMSVQARQQGINIIQFMLYPNGKITNPVIIKSSQYFLLDDNTVETIQAAHKDYPRPQKPTLIRIYVKYELR